jgi:hypothetical protein
VRIIKGRAADCCAISTARSRAAITTNLARSSLTLVFCNFVMIRPNDRLGGHHPTMKNFTCDSRPSHGLVPGGRRGEFERLAESTSLPRVKTPNQSRMSSTANEVFRVSSGDDGLIQVTVSGAQAVCPSSTFLR